MTALNLVAHLLSLGNVIMHT